MKRTLVLVSLLALALSLAPVSAATPPPVPVGLAWDSVLKFIQGSDAANLQPGTFDADFQTASQPVAAPPSRGGILGRFSAAIDQAAAMASGFKTGMATAVGIHYQTVGYIERGEYAPSLAVALRLAALFGRRAPAFIDGHQHVHALPGVREVVLDAIAAGPAAPAVRAAALKRCRPTTARESQSRRSTRRWGRVRSPPKTPTATARI